MVAGLHDLSSLLLHPSMRFPQPKKVGENATKGEDSGRSPIEAASFPFSSVWPRDQAGLASRSIARALRLDSELCHNVQLLLLSVESRATEDSRRLTAPPCLNFHLGIS
ncbi:hypothetical protein P5V15_012576 [Pogonomyrmex californicus]